MRPGGQEAATVGKPENSASFMEHDFFAESDVLQRSPVELNLVFYFSILNNLEFLVHFLWPEK